MTPNEKRLSDQGRLTRRTFVLDAAGVVAAGSVVGRLVSRRRPWWKPAADLSVPHPSQLEALRVLGRSQMRMPDSLPDAAIAAGTDTIPEIEHVVMLMMENHSYDNFFGMLGRGPGQKARGDGFTIALDGYPTASNPYPNGQQLRAFPMPTTCQLSSQPTQEWEEAHIQYDGGRNDGFVISQSGPVAMGYWDQNSLPFTYSLASQFPIGDRWFCSVLGQTDPNRRYLIAATSNGMTDDIGTGPGNGVPDSTLAAPPANGTIFERLSDAGISWLDYNEGFPTGATMELYPSPDTAYESNQVSMSQFFTDAKNGTLPQFSFLDPDYSTQSQENPQNIVVGEAFLASVVEALGSSPLWRKTLLIINYDEHGGYYDHVPPPAALAPDSVPPAVQPGESTYDGFARYGFRVPSVIVGPYAKTNYVSHVVYDHTSVLAFLERKWNLPAMTNRDANANDLLDFLDMDAMSKGQPTFPELPKLAAAGNTPARLACSTTGPGTIPPSLPAQTLELRSAKRNRRLRALVLEFETNHGTFLNLTIELYRGRHLVAHHKVSRVTALEHRVVLRVDRRAPVAGHYTIVVRRGRSTLLRHSLKLR
jgi:phospholipase C